MSIRKRVEALEQADTGAVDLRALAGAMREEGRDVTIEDGRIIEVIDGRKWFHLGSADAVVVLPDNGRD